MSFNNEESDILEIDLSESTDLSENGSSKRKNDGTFAQSKRTKKQDEMIQNKRKVGRPQTSTVYRYFVEINSIDRRCERCKIIVKHGNNKNLKNHLEVHHPELYKIVEVEDEKEKKYEKEKNKCESESIKKFLIEKKNTNPMIQFKLKGKNF